MKTLVRWINALTRLVLGAGIIDLFRKASRSKIAVLQIERHARQDQFIEALLMAEAILNEWYPVQASFERLFRFYVMGGSLDWLKEKMRDWEPRAKKEYNAALARAYWMATEGRFQEAIARLEPINAKFYQPEGQALLNRLYPIVAARESFNLGLFAEKSRNFPVASEYYQNAEILAAEWQNECRIRLAIVAVKTHNWAKALSHLDTLDSEQAVYIRGFVCTTLERQQRKDERNLVKQDIRELVDQGDLEGAESASRNFLKKFGDDPLVRKNLYQHIQPSLEITLWKSQDWQRIAEIAEQYWLERWDVTALHNWALATYYQVCVAPSRLSDLIVAWSTALANLHNDPALQQIPWLGDTPVDLSEVFTALKHRLETLVNDLQDESETSTRTTYTLYRLEVKALELMGIPPQRGLRVKGLFITPGCYQRYHDRLQIPPLPCQLWGTLYTPWWAAILACLDGDVNKAMQMKPQDEPTSAVERYAQQFVSYHEGCYYLQLTLGSYCWNLAIAPLRQARAEIRKSPEWSAEIDRLAEQQYKAIFWNVGERREFVRFWYDLVGSPTARSYLENR